MTQCGSSPQPRAPRLPVLPMAAPRAVGVCWGGSGKCVYFCSSPGSCRSEFVALGITNTSLCQLAAGDESDWQHHSVDPSPAVQLGMVPLAKVLVMSPAPVQGEPQPKCQWLDLAGGDVSVPCGTGLSPPTHAAAQAGWSPSLLYTGGLRWLHELLSAHWQHPQAGVCSQENSLSFCCQKHLLQFLWFNPSRQLKYRSAPLSLSLPPAPVGREMEKRKVNFLWVEIRTIL